MAKPKAEAKLTFVSDDGKTTVISTEGSKVAPGTKWKSWELSWGDGGITKGNGKPPSTLQWDGYLETGNYDIKLSIRDSKNNLDEALLDNVFITRNPIPVPVGPNITLVNPTSADIGATVILTGTNLGNGVASTVTVNGVLAVINSWNDTQVSFIVPNTSTGPIALSTPEGIATAFLTVTSPQAFDWFVDVNIGNDSWNGRFATFQGGNNGPFRTIGKASTVVSSGEDVGIAPGNYHEGFAWAGWPGGTLGNAWNQVIRFIKNGVGTVLVDAIPGFDFVLFARGSVSGATDAPKYIEFSGITFDGRNVNHDVIKITAWDSSNTSINFPAADAPAHHFRFQNCRLTSVKNLGHTQQAFMNTFSSDGCELINCEIDNVGDRFSSPNSQGVYGAASGLLLDMCYFHDIDGYGYSGGSSYVGQVVNNHTIKRCRATRCDQAFSGAAGGFNMGQGTGHLFYSNIAHHNAGRGFALAFFAGDGIKLYYNTAAFNGMEGILVDFGQINARVSGNISFGNASNYVDNGIGTVDSDPNLMDGTDPLFVDGPNANFRLQPGSPAIGAGVTLGDVPDDFYGNSRTVPYDLGAVKFGAA